MAEEQKNQNGWGIASLIIGLFSIPLLIFPPIGILFAIISIVFFFLQRKTQTNGIAIAGLILGIIGAILNSLILLFIIIVLMTFDDDYTEEMDWENEIKSNTISENIIEDLNVIQV